MAVVGTKTRKKNARQISPIESTVLLENENDEEMECESEDMTINNDEMFDEESDELDSDGHSEVSSEQAEEDDALDSECSEAGEFKDSESDSADEFEAGTGFDFAQFSEASGDIVSVDDSDEEELLDAYYAEFGDPDLINIMKKLPTADESVREVVIGADDRTQITATTTIPWRWICSLKIKAKDNTSWIGTGWLVGPGTVITAGHCVYMKSHGGWAKSIEVIPGRNGSSRPYGSCTSTCFKSVKGWTSNNKRNYDYGAIILPSNKKFGNQLGYFGYANYNRSTLKNMLVNLSGYPGDKPSGTQWYHARKIKDVDIKKVVYNIDTAGGQSGSPVWRNKDGKRYAVGIHTNGHSSGNSATRITKEVFDNIKNWKNAGN